MNEIFREVFKPTKMKWYKKIILWFIPIQKARDGFYELYYKKFNGKMYILKFKLDKGE